jgi:hypothetical protein
MLTDKSRRPAQSNHQINRIVDRPIARSETWRATAQASAI